MSDAIWAVIGVVLGTSLTAIYSLIQQKRQFEYDQKTRNQDNASQNQIKSILLDMLSHKSFTDRSFMALRERIGGLTDEELRLLLHGLGARKTTRKNGTGEWWYLQERVKERIEKRRKERA